ncbi:MAG: hypothetical protein H6706_29740 [Myxococcales bacterium]|nr:hypothetical protein [Myxococcales bacterium]
MSDEHEGLAAWLQAQRGELLPEPPPGAHLDDERLAALAEGRGRLRRAEVAHLARCPACREVAAAVVEAVPAAAVRRRRVWPWLVVPLAAAAALAFLLLRPTSPGGEWQVRGGGGADADAPDVAIVAHDAGSRRVLLDGGRVSLGGRLSFRYGNAAGRARGLVILAWDGATLHPWYPERLDAPPFPLQPGVGVPLPFDVELTPPHRAGPLTIAIAFDEAPAAVAARLRAGQPMAPPGQVLHVDVEAP